MAFFSHYGSVLWTILKLKRWRFLWFFIFALSAMSNHLLYDIMGSWVSNFGLQSYFQIGGDEFAANSIVVGNVLKNPNEFAILSDLINEQRVAKKKKYEIEECKFMQKDGMTEEEERMDCTLHFLSKIVSQSANKFTHLVEFSNPPKLTCNMAYGTEVYCPFIGNLVSTANYNIKGARFRFRNVTTFRYVPLSKPLRPVKAGGDTMCAKDPEFSIVMPRAIIVQAFLLICSLFIYLLASTVSSIADLKGRGFLQMLFRRGLSVPAYWLALWTITLIELVIMGAILAASYYMQCKGFYTITRMLWLMLAFCIHACTITSLIFLMTVLTQKQFIIGMATMMLASCCCVVLALSLVLLHWLKNLSDSRYGLLAVPPGLLGEQLQAILVGQLRPEMETNFHRLILIVSGCLWLASLLLTLYLDYVLSSGNGLFLRTANFPCLMLCGSKRKQQQRGGSEQPSAVVEPVAGLNPFVHVRNLNKTFVSCRSSHEALSNVSVTLYENQLTAFVGHNGSGKSTLFDILNGNSSPSQGEIYMLGYDLRDMKTRYSLASYTGICFQHDALCNGITVASTIALVHSACGMESPRSELDYILKQLGLTDKLNQQVGQLSSGQKRKLCTVLALLGNPKLICLDEPTSNLDPASRRALWKLLQEYRRGRCIVVSTSRMEEADIMADRKVFLSGGSLICSGSSVFLRRAFDCGFIFQTRVKTERHVGWVLRYVNQKYPVVRARSIYRSNIELEVSATEDKLLPGVAETLEKMPDLVESFGLAQNSLEQIFSRLKSMPRKDVEQLFVTGEIGYTVEKPLELSGREQNECADVMSPTWSRSFTRHTPSLIRRIVAMIIISFARIRRKNSTIFTRICFPVLLILLLIGSVVAEMLIKGGQLRIWSHLLNNETKHFKKALCIDDKDNKDATHTHDGDRVCHDALGGINNSDISYPFTRKTTNTMLYSYLQEFLQSGNPKVRLEFHKQCSQRSSIYEPCPVLHVSNWCLDEIDNINRTVSVGYYSLHEYFDIEVATRNMLLTFRRMALNFNIKNATNMTMQLEGGGVEDFRTTFMPLLGIFFQMLILCIIPATYMDDLIEDKSSGVRDQLKTLGMGSFHYWICIFIAHWIQHSIVYIVTTIAIVSLLSNSYLYGCFILCVFLPTLFLGLTSNQLCVYLFSTIFAKHNVMLTVVYSIFVLVLVMSLLLAQLDNMAGLILICIFPPVASLAPTFYGSKMIIYAKAFTKVKSLSELPNTVGIIMMSLHLQVSLLAMVAHILLLCLAIFIVERLKSISCQSNKGANSQLPLSGDNQAVQEETDRLDSNPRDSQNLLEVRHLRVVSQSGANIIRDVSFAVKPGEIFGLIGPNGSGKTSVVSAIAGHMRQHSGDCEALIEDNSWIPSRVATLQGKIGYCQSSNPLLSHITVQEHLTFYAAVLGVESVRDLVEELLKIFHLEEWKDKLVVKISDGCKRRLSMAIALIGDPSIILIDDPSDGVDSEGRHRIWAAIKSIARENRAVVVTMHTMEEDVDKLCTRVGVMNHGLLVGLGNVDQILNRYGQIYALSMQFAEDVDNSDFSQARVEKALDEVHAKFPDSFVVEQMAARILVCVPISNIDRLSSVLKWLVDHKKPLGIVLFSFRRVYLDEIFELIVKNHDDGLLKRKHSIFSVLLEDSQLPQLPQQPAAEEDASINI